MAKITKKDISEKDPFGEVGRSALSAKENVLLLENSIKMLGSVAKNVRGSLKGLTPKNSASIKKINQETQKANIIAKEREGLQRKLNVANSNAIQKNAELNEQLKIQRKTNTQLAKDKLGLISVYQKESQRLIGLRNRYKELALTNKQNTAEGKRLLRNLTSLDKKLKRVDGTVGQFQRNVGNYTKAVGRMRAGLMRLAGALGVVGGFMLFRRVLTGSFNIIKDFEQANADLASVLANATGPQLEKLTAQQKELGSTTIFTASQVAELQKEFAKLGFDTTQIGNMTEATLDLAAATGTDLAEAAMVAGGIMNGFRLDSSETQRVVDVMAKSFSSSALDMEKFKESMKTAVPIAKATGIGLEQTTAAAGILADNMISGSKAGTDLKRIFSELVKDGLPLEESLDNIAKQMDAVSTPAEKLAIAEDLVKERAKGALLILVEQRKELKTLTGELENSAGAAKAMADKQINTLGGAIKLLTSAWEGWILKMNDSTGVGNSLTKIIQFMAKNLEAILSVIGELILAFITYKTTVIAINTITKVQIFLAKAHRISQLGLSRAIKLVTKSFKAMTVAQKANIIGAIAAVVVLLAMQLRKLATATTLAEDALTKFNGQLAREQAELQLVFERLKATTEGTEARKKVIIEINDKYGPYLDSLLTEKSTLEEIEIAQLNANKALEQKIFLQVKEESLTVQLTKKLEASAKARLDVTTKLNKEGRSQTNVNNILKKQEELVRRLADSFNELGFQGNDAFQAQQKIKKEANTFIKNFPELQSGFSGFDSGIIKTAQAISEAETELKNINKAFEQTGLALDIIDDGTGGATDPEDEPDTTGGSGAKKEIQTRLRDLKELLRLNKLKTEQLVTENTPAAHAELLLLKEKSREHLKDIKIIEDLLKLDKDKGDPQAQRRIELLNAEIKAKKKLQIIDIDDAIDENGNGLRSKDLTDPNFIDPAKVARELATEKARINIFHDKEDIKRLKEKLTEEFFLNGEFNTKTIEELNQLKDKILKNQNIIKKAKFEAFQEENLKEQLDLEIQFKADQVAGDFKTKKQLIKAEKEFQKELNELKIEALENEQTLYDIDSKKFKQLENQIQSLLLQNKKLDDKEDLETRKQNLKLQQDAIVVFTELFITQSNKRIEKINEEISAAERQASLLEGLAKNGNITARESLAEQDRIIADANRRKAEEEKRQQRILLVSSVLEAYNNELENDVPAGQAFAKAVTSTAILTQFIGALPTFFDGIEDTGSNGQGIDGRGGFTAILHPNERVMTKEQNAKIGGYSNDEVAKIVNEYRYGQYMTLSPSTEVDKTNIDLKNELALVRKAIEDKPEQVIELGRISQAAMTIRETTRKGNRITTNTFKVN